MWSRPRTNRRLTECNFKLTPPAHKIIKIITFMVCHSQKCHRPCTSSCHKKQQGGTEQKIIDTSWDSGHGVENIVRPRVINESWRTHRAPSCNANTKPANVRLFVDRLCRRVRVPRAVKDAVHMAEQQLATVKTSHTCMPELNGSEPAC